LPVGATTPLHHCAGHIRVAPIVPHENLHALASSESG
jgi:hypothetical protein